MPRLLSALTLLMAGLGLAACSGGDITVKTDLDEKYIVKESAVTTAPYDWETKKKQWEENVRYAKRNVAGAIDGKSSCLRLGLGEEYCNQSWNVHLRDCEKDLKDSEESLRQVQSLQGKGDNPVQLIRYRSIFVDVNNEKHAMGYVSVTCLNPELTSKQAKDMFKLLFLKEDEVNKKKSPKQNAFKAVSLQVCRKYAYPETSRFSFTLDEDQSEDKAGK